MSLIALLVTAFYLDWRLAIIAFIGFPIVVLPIASLSKKVRRETKNQQKQLSGLQSLLVETFQGNRVVKAFGMEDYERARFNRELKRLFRIFMRVARIKAFTGPLIEALGAFAVVAVVWWAVGSLQAGTRTLGQFAGFFAVMILVYPPFKGLSKTNNTIQQGLAAAERVFEMMDLPSEVPDDPDGIELQPGPAQRRVRERQFSLRRRMGAARYQSGDRRRQSRRAGRDERRRQIHDGGFDSALL